MNFTHHLYKHEHSYTAFTSPKQGKRQHLGAQEVTNSINDYFGWKFLADISWVTNLCQIHTANSEMLITSFGSYSPAAHFFNII